MFDNPPPLLPPPARPRRAKPSVLAAAVVLALGASTLWQETVPRPSAIIRAPSGLVQVEIFSSSGGTRFYLHRAGFKLRHDLQFLARLPAGQGWAVQWTGPETAKIIPARHG